MPPTLELSTGSCYLTNYGPGVIVASSPTIYTTLLLRDPNASIASCSIGYLNSHCFLTCLPAIPGMKVSDTATSTTYTVQSYSPQTSTFLLTSPTSALLSVPASALSSSFTIRNTARFTPLLFFLMTKADTLSKHSALLPSLLKTTTSSLPALPSSTAITAKVDTLSDKISSSLSEAPLQSRIKSLTASIDPSHATEILTLLQKDDIKTLLTKSRERLQTLMNGLPKHQQKLMESSGIEITLKSTTSETISSVLTSQNRQKALTALNSLLDEDTNMLLSDTLQHFSPDDLSRHKKKLADNFQSVMSSLGEAGSTDSTLNSLVTTFNSKTLELQQITDSFLETSTMTTLFEGAERLKSRTKTLTSSLLSPDQLAQLQQNTTNFLAKLSDGDEALLQLKSLELGDNLKDRLITTLQARTASKGGLDSMIASALLAIEDKTSTLDSDLRDLITKMKATSSSAASSTPPNELLLTLLSQKSKYREVVLVALEKQLISLDSQLTSSFGHILSSDDILALAIGEKGTAELFEPIAKKTQAEICKHLDQAEAEYGGNETNRTVLLYVRQIVNQEKTLDCLVGDTLTHLNGESSVAKGQEAIMKAERLLDSIESASKTKEFTSITSAIKTAGFSEDDFIVKLQNVDVNDLLNKASSLYNDKQAQHNMLSSATDSALDFLLSVLPNVDIPVLEGVKDGTMYNISDLSLKGFKMKKEDIHVQIAGVSINQYTDVSAGGEEGEEREEGEEGEEGGGTIEVADEVVGDPTELLIIRVDNIQANMNGVHWSFNQTYFPYLKGSGEADAAVENAYVEMKFELRKMKKESPPDGASILLDTGDEFVPVLCLHKSDCTIEAMDLKLKGDSMSWLYNLMTTVFNSVLRDYVVKAVLTALKNSSGYLLEMLNANLFPHWPMILKMSGLALDKLQLIDESAIVDTQHILNKDFVELVWRDPVPLGMQLLMNDGSGEVKVVEFPAGGQARRVAEAASLDPDFFKGATICAVNGWKFAPPKQLPNNQMDATKINQVLVALKDPARPKSIEFELSESERERIMRLLGKLSNGASVEDGADKRALSKTLFETIIELEGPLGLSFGVGADEVGLVVAGFKDGKENAYPKIKIGLVLVSVNGEACTGKDHVSAATELFSKYSTERPMKLKFAEPVTVTKVHSQSQALNSTSSLPNLKKTCKAMRMHGCPVGELQLSEARIKEDDQFAVVVLTGYDKVPGPIECGGAQCGDFLLSVNGVPFFVLDDKDEAEKRVQLGALIEDAASYPICFDWARPLEGSGQVEGGKRMSSEYSLRYSVQVEKKVELGVGFKKADGYLCISKLAGVAGVCQAENKGGGDGGVVGTGMAVFKINGHVVPRAAAAADVFNAMRRGWADQGESIEITWKDYVQEEWLSDALER